MQIVRATPKDAAALSALALAAKQHWGYPAEWMEQWTPLLTITPAYLAAQSVYTAIIDDGLIGFGAFTLQDRLAALEHLWVLPQAMNRGVGRALFCHFEKLAAAAGATELTIESDPNAEGFYLRMGAERVGQSSSMLEGGLRFLPRLRKRLV